MCHQRLEYFYSGPRFSAFIGRKVEQGRGTGRILPPSRRVLGKYHHLSAAGCLPNRTQTLQHKPIEGMHGIVAVCLAPWNMQQSVTTNGYRCLGWSQSLRSICGLKLTINRQDRISGERCDGMIAVFQVYQLVIGYFFKHRRRGGLFDSHRKVVSEGIIIFRLLTQRICLWHNDSLEDFNPYMQWVTQMLSLRQRVAHAFGNSRPCTLI